MALTHYLLVTSADNFCKQFGPRSGLIERQTWSGSNLFDTQLIPEIIFRKSWKKSADDKKAWKFWCEISTLMALKS